MCAALVAGGCKAAEPGRSNGDTTADAAASALETGAAAAAAPARGPAPGARDEATGATAAELRAARLERLIATFVGASEEHREFFSDNYISNETSYLQVAEPIERHVPEGGAYLGVGPEQNFTYIAMTRPKIAYIVDIRRDNALLHLLYKAMFERATSRAHFLSLWTGRPFDPERAPPPGADLETTIAAVEQSEPDRTVFDREHQALVDLLTTTHGLPLSKDDLASISLAHRAFFEGQLDLRFQLKFNNGRRYPSLRELLLSVDPRGRAVGFLATDEAFEHVQRLQREHLVIPVVGDFAGDRAVASVGKAIRDAGLSVSAFYVSNVEQYLLEGKVWDAWVQNVATLPTTDASVFIRAYLDQGRAHPRQLPGHRTASVISRVADFQARQASRPFTSFYEVATERVLE